jgi:hypothetical protein
MDFLAIHAAIALTTGFAAFVPVAFAIGYALIAIPILSLIVGTKTAIAIGLFFNVFTGAQFWFHRQYVSWPDAIAILPVSLAATLVGLFFFYHVHEAALSGVLAAYLIVFVVRARCKINAPSRLSFCPSAALRKGLHTSVCGPFRAWRTNKNPARSDAFILHRALRHWLRPSRALGEGEAPGKPPIMAPVIARVRPEKCEAVFR